MKRKTKHAVTIAPFIVMGLYMLALAIWYAFANDWNRWAMNTALAALLFYSVRMQVNVFRMKEAVAAFWNQFAGDHEQVKDDDEIDIVRHHGTYSITVTKA